MLKAYQLKYSTLKITVIETQLHSPELFLFSLIYLISIVSPFILHQIIWKLQEKKKSILAFCKNQKLEGNRMRIINLYKVHS